MLTYSMTDRGSLSLYDYLYRCIRTDILSGRLANREKLPSKRALARHLSVSVVTVEHAYAQLEAEGYLRSEEKRGYFVARVARQPEAVPRELPPIQPPERPRWFLDLTTNRVGRDFFPSALWARLMRQILAEPDLLEAAPSNGAPGLRAAIADYLYRFRGMTVSPEQIVVGAGTEYLYTLLIQLLGRDKIYAVEDPGYQKIARVYGVNGVTCRAVGLDGQGLSLDLLRRSGADVVHLSPSHHFPTGLVTPVGRRQELLAWAAEREGRYILEDDYDSEFRFSGRPIPTMQSIDGGERVIYLNTFSKTIAPSIRISYLVLPPHLLTRFQEKLGFYSCTVPSPEQYTLEKFIREGYFERHLNRTRTRYRALRDKTINALLNSPLGTCCDISGEDAGLHFLLHVDLPLSDAELVSRAAEAGVRLSCLSDYLAVPDPAYSRRVVVSYAGADPERLEEAAGRLAKAWG